MEEQSNFMSNFKDLAKKYGPYAILASLVLGAGNTYLAFRAKPANETAKQRRNRLIKAFLLPSLTTALGSAALGASALAFKSDLTPEAAKKLDKIEEKLNSETNKNSPTLLSSAGSIAAPTLAFAGGAGAGTKMIGNPTSHAIKKFGPITRATTRSTVRGFGNMLSKAKNRKLRVLGRILKWKAPKSEAANPGAFDAYVSPVIGAGSALSGGAMGLGAERAAENYLKDIAFGEERPIITQSDVAKFDAVGEERPIITQSDVAKFDAVNKAINKAVKSQK